jgi:hypothetical protein
MERVPYADAHGVAKAWGDESSPGKATDRDSSALKYFAQYSVPD